MPNPPTIEHTLDQVLEILGVSDQTERERLTGEVNQLVQARAMQLVLESIPAIKQGTATLNETTLKPLLKQYTDAPAVDQALSQAITDIIPDYLAELSQTGTKQQQKQIEALLQ